MLGTATFMRRVYRIDSVNGRDIAYALVLTSDTQAAALRYDAEFEAVRQSVRITTPQALAVTPELGKVVGDRYLNATYQVSATIPDGWTPRIGKGQHLFELSLLPPDSAEPAPAGSLRVVMLGAVDLGTWIEPSLAAEANIAAQKARDPNLQVVREEKLERDGVMGYDAVIRFRAADGTDHYSRQVFFSRDTVLFFVVAEINPASLAESLQPAIDTLVNSVSFAPVEGD
jgi:hypothetical protein